MTYKVVLSRQARRYYSMATPELTRRLAQVFESLESDQCPAGAKPLKGELEGLFRIRVGGVRVVYEPREDFGEISLQTESRYLDAAEQRQRR